MESHSKAVKALNPGSLRSEFLSFFLISFSFHVQVGEWTTAFTDCAVNLNGYKKGNRYDGSLPGSEQNSGDCKPKRGSASKFSAGYKENLAKSEWLCWKRKPIKRAALEGRAPLTFFSFSLSLFKCGKVKLRLMNPVPAGSCGHSRLRLALQKIGLTLLVWSMAGFPEIRVRDPRVSLAEALRSVTKFRTTGWTFRFRTFVSLYRFHFLWRNFHFVLVWFKEGASLYCLSFASECLLRSFFSPTPPIDISSNWHQVESHHVWMDQRQLLGWKWRFRRRTEWFRSDHHSFCESLLSFWDLQPQSLWPKFFLLLFSYS